VQRLFREFHCDALLVLLMASSWFWTFTDNFTRMPETCQLKNCWTLSQFI
jgi:hypothetical protein